MIVYCDKCFSCYDDASCWTICPHGPLWAAPNAYCRKHDLVNCDVCKEENKPSFPRSFPRKNTRDWFRAHPKILTFMRKHNRLRERLENWFGIYGFSVPLYPEEKPPNLWP